MWHERMHRLRSARSLFSLSTLCLSLCPTSGEASLQSVPVFEAEQKHRFLMYWSLSVRWSLKLLYRQTDKAPAASSSDSLPTAGAKLCQKLQKKSEGETERKTTGVRGRERGLLVCTAISCILLMRQNSHLNKQEGSDQEPLRNERKGGSQGRSEQRPFSQSLSRSWFPAALGRASRGSSGNQIWKVYEWRALLFSLFTSHFPSIHLFTRVRSVDRRVHSGVPLILTRGILGEDLSQLEEPLAFVGGNNFSWVMEKSCNSPLASSRLYVTSQKFLNYTV